MGIRDTSYYGWQDLVIVESTPSKKVDDVDIFCLVSDVSGNLFCGGYVDYENENREWIVAKSKNEGVSWEIIDGYPSEGSTFSIALSMAIDSSGSLYVCGWHHGTGGVDWTVRKSTTRESGSFTTVDSYDRGTDTEGAYAVAVDSGDNVYVCGYEDTPFFTNWIIRKSSDNGASFTTIDATEGTGYSTGARSIAIDSSDNIYVCGTYDAGAGTNWVVRKSTTGLSSSFLDVDSFDRDGGNDIGWSVVIDPSDNIYVTGEESVGGIANLIIRSSSDAGSTFEYLDSDSGIEGSGSVGYSIAIASAGEVYVVGEEKSTWDDGGGTDKDWIVRKSENAGSGTFSTINRLSNDRTYENARVIHVDSYDNIFIAGASKGKGVLRKGRFTANSSSLGPSMFATSIGYVAEEPVSGSLVEKFKLNNISEYPHHGGLFQMPNMVLGTQSTGKIGNTEDSIIQVKYRGSVVSVMWPKQGDQSVPVAGFGDFAAGQRSGKLTTAFDRGDFIDVTEFDHMTLYCYLLKDVSGTLDNIDLQIERRPLKSTPFSVDQVIEYESSGSATLANMKDLVYRKSIDYGDLSIKEIGYPIDVPLTNVREIRVACKQQIGQAEEKNRNLVVWGRFIRSEEGET